MRNTLLIIKNEILTKLRQGSFLFVAFGLPLLGMTLFLVAGAVSRNAPTLSEQLLGPAEDITAVGYVDQAQVIAEIPESIPPDALIAYADEAEAQQALNAGEIKAYYLIPADIIEQGELIYVEADADLFAISADNDYLNWALTVNLAGGDAELARAIINPVQVETISLASTPQRDEDNPLTFLLPYGLTMMFYFVIFGTASHNISSMTIEKENRVIEILMTTVNPRQMFSGKIIGLGIVGLLQALVWIGSSYLFIQLGGQRYNLPAEFEVPFSIVLWGILFFVLGYFVYAGLMSGLGALVPNLREAAQAAFVINSPLLLSLILIGVLIDKPNGPVAITLSLFPLTAPVVMMTRLSASNSVPLWQILLAIVLLIITIIFIIRTVTHLFQAQTLLSGEAFNLRRFFRAITGRV